MQWGKLLMYTRDTVSELATRFRGPEVYSQMYVLVGVFTVANSGPWRCRAILAASPNYAGVRHPY